MSFSWQEPAATVGDLVLHVFARENGNTLVLFSMPDIDTAADIGDIESPFSEDDGVVTGNTQPIE